MSVTEDHIQANFSAFLQIYPEYNEAVQDVAHALYHQIEQRGLPHNENCLELINSALLLPETLEGDDYQAYQELTGYSEPCARQQNKELLQNAALFDLPPLTPRLSQLMAQQTIKNAQKSTQGLTPRTQSALVDILARDHLPVLAEVTREATLFAMLDEECIELHDIVNELAAEGLFSELSPRERYDTLMLHVSIQLSDHVTAKLRHFFDNPPAPWQPPAPVRAVQQMLKKF